MEITEFEMQEVEKDIFKSVHKTSYLIGKAAMIWGWLTPELKSLRIQLNNHLKYCQEKYPQQVEVIIDSIKQEEEDEIE